MEIGARFARLVVVRAAPADSRNNKRWECRCDCGATKVVYAANLRHGKTKSCGCLRKDASARKPPITGAGRRPTAEKSYRSMINRCVREYDPAYYRYGGAGITVCDRWRFGDDDSSGLECFLEDMGPRPEGTTLDRIDNTEGYYPENCRWADWKTQARNRSNNRRITAGGTTMTLSEWAERTGIPKTTIAYRLDKGDPPLAALGFT